MKLILLIILLTNFCVDAKIILYPHKNLSTIKNENITQICNRNPIRGIYDNVTIRCINNVWYANGDCYLFENVNNDKIVINGNLYIGNLYNINNKNYHIRSKINVRYNLYINATVTVYWSNINEPLLKVGESIFFSSNSKLLSGKFKWTNIKYYIACVQNTINIPDSSFFNEKITHGIFVERFKVKTNQKNINCSGEIIIYDIKNETGPYIKNNYVTLFSILATIIVLIGCFILFYYGYTKYFYKMLSCFNKKYDDIAENYNSDNVYSRLNQ